jgi:hypothetical protein
MNEVKEIWDKYRKEFWNNIFEQIELQDKIFQDSILFWGVVKLSTFQNSIFFSSCKITSSNENVHVYFISRLLNNNQKIRHYFFLNTFYNKSRILNNIPQNLEEGFLKILYDKNISFSSTFNHRMSWNCWLAILEMESRI